MRRALRSGVVLLALAAGLGGCGDDPPCPERPEAVVADRDVEVASVGPALDARRVGAGASFVLEVTSSQETVERVRFSIDGRTALDVDLPAAADCWGGHQPVFAFGFDLPPGPIETSLDLQGETSAHRVTVPPTGTVWGVVDVQSERGWGDLALYDERPVWG